jgi:hypothetical protein
MGRMVYNLTKAPIGWSLFRDRDRIGAYSREAAASGWSQHPNQRARISPQRNRKTGVVA